jgi:hypothetical protein
MMMNVPMAIGIGWEKGYRKTTPSVSAEVRSLVPLKNGDKGCGGQCKKPAARSQEPAATP